MPDDQDRTGDDAEGERHHEQGPRQAQGADDQVADRHFWLRRPNDRDHERVGLLHESSVPLFRDLAKARAVFDLL
jgi:hypothetical protein